MKEKLVSKTTIRNSLAVQWLGLGAFIAVAPGSIPGQGTKIPQAMGKTKKKKDKTSTEMDIHNFKSQANLNDSKRNNKGGKKGREGR